MSKRADQHRVRRKVRDRSLVLSACGFVLFLPPLASASLLEGALAGIPIPVIYLFSIWISLIVGAGMLSASLLADGEEELPGDAGAGPG